MRASLLAHLSAAVLDRELWAAVAVLLAVPAAAVIAAVTHHAPAAAGRAPWVGRAAPPASPAIVPSAPRDPAAARPPEQARATTEER